MKTNIVFIFAVAVLALTNAESIMEKIRRFNEECNSANALTPHILCINIKLGAMKMNGDIDRNALKLALEEMPNFTSALVNDIVSHCGERNGSTAAEVAQVLKKCMNERYVANTESVRQKHDEFEKECLRADAITPFKLCMFVKLGIMKSNGDIDRNRLKEALEESPDLSSFSFHDIMADCGERRNSTAADAAEALFKCMNRDI